MPPPQTTHPLYPQVVFSSFRPGEPPTNGLVALRITTKLSSAA
jgi:hypothetical protein